MSIRDKKITIIGSGNVGFHLGKRLFEMGFSIYQVFSRNLDKATRLATAIDAHPINQLNQITDQSDIYIIAVKDVGIGRVAHVLSENVDNQKIVVHTSGATSSELISKYFDNYGVFYPLQTFSIEQEVDFEQIPFCIDAKSPEVKETLLELANYLSPKVYRISDRERQILHVAAVFVNNFTNHLYSVGEDILEKEKINFDILKPLIFETARKIENQRAEDMQTGPAKRGDTDTISQHMEYLDKHPEYQKLYKTLTESISKHKAK